MKKRHITCYCDADGCEVLERALQPSHSPHRSLIQIPLNNPTIWLSLAHSAQSHSILTSPPLQKSCSLMLWFTTSLVVWWSESLTTYHEVPGSIPGSTVGIFLEGENSHGDHGLGRLVEFRFKAPPDTKSSYITTHTSSGQRNWASWASQPQKSVTFLPCPGGRTTKSTKRACGGIGGKNSLVYTYKVFVTN